MNELKTQLKQMIITSLNLEDMKTDDISDDVILFSPEGLGLDSVDALELGLAIQKNYGLEMDSKAVNLKEIFKNINSLASYIKSSKENS